MARIGVRPDLKSQRTFHWFTTVAPRKGGMRDNHRWCCGPAASPFEAEDASNGCSARLWTSSCVATTHLLCGTRREKGRRGRNGVSSELENLAVHWNARCRSRLQKLARGIPLNMGARPFAVWKKC